MSAWLGHRHCFFFWIVLREIRESIPIIDPKCEIWYPISMNHFENIGSYCSDNSANFYFFNDVTFQPMQWHPRFGVFATVEERIGLMIEHQWYRIHLKMDCFHELFDWISMIQDSSNSGLAWVPSSWVVRWCRGEMLSSSRCYIIWLLTWLM
jgi:hypothetical protein